MAGRWERFVCACDPTIPAAPAKLVYQLGNPDAWVIARATALTADLIVPSMTTSQRLRIRKNSLRWARIELAEHAYNVIGEILLDRVNCKVMTAIAAVKFLDTTVPSLLDLLLQ